MCRTGRRISGRSLFPSGMYVRRAGRARYAPLWIRRCRSSSRDSRPSPKSLHMTPSAPAAASRRSVSNASRSASTLTWCRSAVNRSFLPRLAACRTLSKRLGHALPVLRPVRALLARVPLGPCSRFEKRHPSTSRSSACARRWPATAAGRGATRLADRSAQVPGSRHWTGSDARFPGRDTRRNDRGSSLLHYGREGWS